MNKFRKTDKTPYRRIKSMSRLSLEKLLKDKEDELQRLYNEYTKVLAVRDDQRMYIVKLQKENMQLEKNFVFLKCDCKNKMEEKE